MFRFVSVRRPMRLASVAYIMRFISEAWDLDRTALRTLIALVLEFRVSVVGVGV